MGFSSPWALVALLAIPVLVWLHRRRDRPVPVDLPSLLFLEGEDVPAEAPRLVRLDRDLLLALVAALALGLAAAGPSVALGSAARVVRVASIAGARAAEAVARIRAAADAADRVDVVEVRRDDAALLRAVRAGDADLRVIVTDRRILPEPRDVRVVAVGDPHARNLGIVAVDASPEKDGLHLFANVWNDSAEPQSVAVMLAGADGKDGESRRVEIPPFSARSVTFSPIPASPADRVGIALQVVDDVKEDDLVTLDRRPVRVGFAKGPDALPEAHRRAVIDGLKAVVGEDLLVVDDPKPEVWIGPAGSAPETATRVLVLHPLTPDGRGVRPRAGSGFEPGPLPWSKDVDPTGCDLVYREDLGLAAPWPIVRTVNATTVEFLPDPLAGSPAPVDHPIWPIFLENLVSERFGRPGPAGYRVVSRADPIGLDTTRRGRDVRPFDPAWLAGVEPSRAAPARSLRGPLVGLAMAALVVLWLRSRSRHPVRAPAG